MKLTHSFDSFLEDDVNLNKTRVEKITNGIKTVATFLKNNELFKNNFRSLTPQGSYRQKTIIKPVIDDADFDVDLLFEINRFDNWMPRKYLEKLHDEFKATDRYKDIVDKRGKSRCVTLDYESDFHIDIVPCVLINGRSWIMNRKEDTFEETDADGYAQWFNRQNSITKNDSLVKVVRLIKYIRDHNVIPIKSVMLTTLLGYQVRSTDGVEKYADLPTAFKLLFDRLDDYLRGNPQMPVVTNPSLPSEHFNRHWDQGKYNDCRSTFHNLRLNVDEAYDTSDLEMSIEKWRAVFGEDFPLDEKDMGQSIKLIESLPLGNSAHSRPLTDICQGERLINKVSIDGYLYSNDGKIKFRGINSDAKTSSGHAIKFVAKTNAKGSYKVFWQVVNTGEHALRESGLRGDYISARLLKGGLSSNPLVSWERTSYTGKHWIECFIVQDGYCVARSGKFYINIKNPNY